MTDSPAHGFKYRAGYMSNKASQKCVEGKKSRKEEEKRDRIESRRRSKSNNSLASVNEEEIDVNTLLQREKRKNEKLSSKLQELKIEFKCTNLQFERMLDTQRETYEREKFQCFKKIEKLQKEVDELRRSQRNDSHPEAQELHNKINQLSKQLRAKEEQISSLKESLSISENKENSYLNEISTLSALLNHKKEYLDGKNQEVEKLNKRLKKKEQETQQKLKSNTENIKLQQQLEADEIFVPVNLSQIQQLEETVQHKQSVIAKRDQEISEHSKLLKNQPVIDILTWIDNQIKMMIDSKIVKSIEDQSKLLGMFDKNKKKIKGFKLLFRASDYYFDAQNNKEMYCGIPDTVLLVKTEYGKVIGGYTPLKWKIFEYGYFEPNNDWYKQHDTSGESFIFSVSNNHKLTLQSPKENSAVQNHNNKGPIFNTGLGICDQSNIKSKSIALYINRLCYVHPEYKGKDKESWIKFTGSQDGKFLTQQWQVHQVIFQES